MKQTNASLISGRKEDEDHLCMPWWGGSKMDGKAVWPLPAAADGFCHRRYPSGNSTAATAAGMR
jgi:hypothetical protein